MKSQDAIKVLADARPETDVEVLGSALAVVASRLSTSQLDNDAYTGIVRSLVDRVAGPLSTTITDTSDEAVRDFELILLEGNPSIAFAELSVALSSSDLGADLIARTLVLFVDERSGGTERLRQILSNAEYPEIASALIHLPSRILNVLLQSSISENDPADIINEVSYAETLAEAIYQQPKTRDPQRDHLSSELLRRLVVTGHSNAIVTRWLAKANPEKLVTAFLRAPQSAVPALLRTLLDVRTADAAENERACQTLTAILRESEAAVEACLHAIPLRRPLLHRPRLALRRLAACVVRARGDRTKRQALLAAAECWGAREFAVGADVLLQRQVTRLLLLYLRGTATAGAGSGDEVMMALVHGVHWRLGERDERVRRHGMVVGEASSRHYGEEEVLRFDRAGLAEMRKGEREVVGEDETEDGSDSDFSDLAAGGGTDDDLFGIDANVLDMDQELIVEAKPANISDTAGANSAPKTEATAQEDATWETEGPDRDWQHEDDWSSLSSYARSSSASSASSSDESTPRQRRAYDALREKLTAPQSVPRMLALLRGQNSARGESGGATEHAPLVAALRALAKRADALAGAGARGGGLRETAGDLAVAALRVEAARFPEAEMREVDVARYEAAVALVRLRAGEVARVIVGEIVCAGAADVERRSEALRVVMEGVRGAAERRGEGDGDRDGDRGDEERDGDGDGVGTVTRRLSRSLSIRHRRARNERTAAGRRSVTEAMQDGEALVASFRTLATFLTVARSSLPTGSRFLDLHDADEALWAQGVLALCVLATHVPREGTGGMGDGCRRELVELAVARVHEGGGAVTRRAVALVLAGIEGGMMEVEVGEMTRDVDGGGALGRGIEWLQRVAEGAGADADVGVRRFAGVALGRWARRFEGLRGDLAEIGMGVVGGRL